MPPSAVVLGVGSATPELAAAFRNLMTKAGNPTRADLKAFILTGNLPAGATITPAVFQRALLVLSSPLWLAGESDTSATDTGL